jgi:hypothetical protein
MFVLERLGYSVSSSRNIGGCIIIGKQDLYSDYEITALAVSVRNENRWTMLAVSDVSDHMAIIPGGLVFLSGILFGISVRKFFKGERR